jgi:Family of unknown function (DUF6252)
MKCRTIAVFVLGIASFLAGCTKYTSYTNPALTGNPFDSSSNFSALISGIKWNAASSSDTASAQDGGISIYGINSLNQSISIFLDDTITGTYKLNANTVSIGVYIDGNAPNTNAFTTSQSNDTSQAGGTVTVTNIDHQNGTISGTFQFNVFRSSDGQGKTVTQGQFSKIPYGESPEQGGNADTFYVQIDSSNWVAPSISANDMSGQFVVYGSTVDGTKSVGLFMPQTITPGTYTLNYSGSTYFGQYNPTDSTTLEAQGNGTLQILENNTVTGRLRGNFNFLAQPLSGPSPTAQLNNGYFSVTVQ